ncbi:MAG: bifunctional UDP-N-acetylmuramoyl-L-alanyl-D-glutamate--2,6-diaminopimelate ligase MurE/UDP-N-acetylmuramoyl-tripeptide--D-alanyl-D-alanine ligase MurF [Betaproteobacteria bacterium]|nr:bifunctional UDP-N-acetylmuramoyl-L-alanyl-D-glutamate--2,6-diaminopimelate ligase MurE/UDP-N-acetylmuramoyl-tripeptide--D-alanyl-D-alanine ligase MurF [Betaproteobacteria bacterium]
MSAAPSSVGAVLHAVRAAAVPAGAAWTCDSRQVQAGDVFIAWPGAASDGRRHLPEAFARGAVAALVEDDGADAFDLPSVTLRVRGLKALAGELAAAWYGQPSRHMTVLAITGTNGKTSCALWAAQALAAAGKPCGVVGTLGVGLPGALQATGLTTPDPVRLQHELAAMRARGVRHVALEASSIGLEEGRLAGLQIHAAGFTNLTQDHLDYHGDMAAYASAKRRLFDAQGLQAAVLNIDDPMGAILAQHTAQRGVRIITTALDRPADWGAELADMPTGMAVGLRHAAQRAQLALPLVGRFNAANVLVVCGLLQSCGLDFEAIVQALGAIVPPPGRMQLMGGRDAPLVVVDYAHTPDAIAQALQALRPAAQARGGKLWCLLGAGGDRDRSKRAPMAAAAEGLADRVVLTSDNPRSEAPQAILDDLLQGLVAPVQGLVVADRAQAIAETVAHAAAADVVLLAGKGHETTQEQDGRRVPFADGFHTRLALAQRGGGLFALRELQAWVGGRLHGDGSIPISRVCTDTRSLRCGDMFVALRGERFDAHDFLSQAAAAGAVAVLAERGVAPSGLSGVEVADSLQALGLLARAWRRQQGAMALAAVTGSNGKTTVTQMIAAILAAWLGEGGRLATQGNFNNEVGLPLTLLRLQPQHLAGVVELGMNHPGEVARLAAIAEPTVALVNNAQREHQEFMHTVEAVARENGSVLAALAPSGVAVYPATDSYAPLWQSLAAGRRLMRFALHAKTEAPPAAEVSGWAEMADPSDRQAAANAEPGMRLHLRSPAGEARLRMQVMGAHNAHNALAAAAVALACGAPLDAVATGLEAFRPVAGRMQRSRLELPGGQIITLIDDSYNANPDSVRAAIDALAALPGRRLLVLGDMGEVGTQGTAFHIEAGSHAAACRIDAVWAVGDLARHVADAAGQGGVAVRHAAHAETLAVDVAALHGFDAVLVKGSRFMRMERVVRALQALGTRPPGAGPKEAKHAA